MRDLKPSNLFLRDDRIDRLTVLDFGIARWKNATTLTQAGYLVGTPGYMAPEQARGDLEIGPAADIFALGCVLFECLAGPLRRIGLRPLINDDRSAKRA